jgi:hypothetical protein
MQSTKKKLNKKCDFEITIIFLECWYGHTALNSRTSLFEYKHTLLRISAHPRTFFFKVGGKRARLFRSGSHLSRSGKRSHLVCLTSRSSKKISSSSLSNISSQCLHYLQQTNKSSSLWRISCFASMSMPSRKIMLWYYFVRKSSSLKSKEKSELYAIEVNDCVNQKKKKDVISLIDALSVSFLLLRSERTIVTTVLEH